MADDRFRAAWRRHFSLMLHPHIPILQSLIEAADKLDAARGFLEPLSPDSEAEREQGLVVASLAIEYALKLLDHHGLIDGPEPPMPVNLAQARQAVGNLLAFVQENVELGRMAEGQTIIEAEPGEDEAPTAGVTPDRDESRLAVDEATFSVRYRGKECLLGNTKEFRLMERLARSRGTYLRIFDLIDDVWADSEPEKGTVQKTISNLRKKLADAGLGPEKVSGTENRLSVPDTFSKPFPEQAPYKGETIIHHHLDYGPTAIPLPETVHSRQPGWGIWHPDHAGGP
jgi:hypothetical protein